MNEMLSAMVAGAGATMLVDGWGATRKWMLGIPAADYSMVGRWIGHMAHGQFRHDRIASTSPIPGERVIGWSIHYLIGIAFAAAFIAIVGVEWLRHPTLLSALTFGVCTVAAPFLLMQPGMGAGIAASRTPNPESARLHSILTHAVFGLGLWITAWLVQALST